MIQVFKTEEALENCSSIASVFIHLTSIDMVVLAIKTLNGLNYLVNGCCSEPLTPSHPVHFLIFALTRK